MTSAQFANSKYKPIAMPMPFGADDVNNYTIPGLVHSASSVNFPDGFPVAYSSPHSGGGKYVTRKEMNGIGNVASRYEFFRRVGGIVTFDPAFATAIGGYPQGIVLDFVDGMNVHKVYSAVDNNTVNFLTNGVDGVNWVYMNQDKGSIETVLFAMDSVPPEGYDTPLGIFKATRSGAIKVTGTIEKNTVETYTETLTGATASGTYQYYTLRGGYAILICSLGTGSTPSDWPIPTVTNTSSTQSVNWNGYYSIMGDYGVTTVRQPYNSQWTYGTFLPPTFQMYITSGTWYGVKCVHADDLRIVSTNVAGAGSTMVNERKKTLLSGGITIYLV